MLKYRQKCDILITGDRSRDGELRLLQRTELPELELLIAGHHGSKYSSCEAFLEQSNSEIAVISSGRGNRYGHPHKETIERLESIGSKVLRNDEKGQISIKVDGEKGREGEKFWIYEYLD